jgi:acyl-CoA synthetase (AMP-forming)/AMP-acid ligase II
MILGDPASARPAPIIGRLSIDAVFRQLAARQPNALALVDPPNRETFTDGVARRLTYAAADRVVAAIAACLLRMGLPPDSVVGVQLPNIVENILTMLGVLRAGMIVAPMPLLWRRVDAAAALTRVSAKALITCGRVGAFDHGHLAREVASEVFSIRYVGGFGRSLPDGVVALDDLLEAQDAEPAPEPDARSLAPAHIAAITFAVGADGVIPVARSHAELLTGGLGVLLESRLAERTNILSTILPSSFAGISVTLVPWLLSAGALVLHQPFTADVLTRQRREHRCGALILPGPVAVDVAEIAGAGERPSRVIALWRSPAQLADGKAWRDQDATFVDVSSFGEIALVAARRASTGKPSQLTLRPVTTPREHKDGIVVVELARTAAGTIAARGPMVPRHAFPPGVERTGLPCLNIGPDEFVDTGYPCHLEAVTRAIATAAA